MTTACEALHKRAEKAFRNGQNWRAQWDDLYAYALPSRRPASQHNQGNPRTELVFDATATKAAFRFAGRVQRDAVPPFQEFVELKLGPAAKAALSMQFPEDQLKDMLQQAAKDLKVVAEVGHALLESSNFALASGEMFLDYFGGQGALLMLEDEDQIAEFVSVPAATLGLREDGKGRITGIYWPKPYRAGDLETSWPKVELYKELADKVKDAPDDEVMIVQATEYDPKAKKWIFTVYAKDDPTKPPLYSRDDLDYCNWLVPRFYKVPGEAYGRGPGLMALPTIKTLNKVTELTLKAVAFAILGLWTYRNDRVFNPKTARMTPGAMWAVSSNGGTMGPALQRVEMPGRYDISNIVLQDLRMNVKEATFDDTLPPDSGAVRSATEIVERMKRLMADLASAYPRLMREMIIPLWQWLIDVMWRRKLIATRLPIDQLVTKLTITSPIARAQQAQDVSNIVNWLQIILSIGGQEAMMLAAKIEDVFAHIGEKLGVPPDMIRNQAERKGIMNMVAQIIANAQMQGQKPPAMPANQGAAPAAAA